VIDERGDRGRDLGPVGGQRRNHPQQGFGEAQALAHTLETLHETQLAPTLTQTPAMKTKTLSDVDIPRSAQPPSPAPWIGSSAAR